MRGKRGRGSKKTVATTSIKSVMQEHFTCVSEPGGEYLTHVTPCDATGRAIAKELVAVVRENNLQLEVMGMVGCCVNTGIHYGVIRVTEQELGVTVQHIICLLHLNELYFCHELHEVDGVTSGPGKRSFKKNRNPNILRFLLWANREKVTGRCLDSSCCSFRSCTWQTSCSFRRAAKGHEQGPVSGL